MDAHRSSEALAGGSIIWKREEDARRYHAHYWTKYGRRVEDTLAELGDFAGARGQGPGP